MSIIKKFYCDRCGKEFSVINNAQLSEKSARIDLFAIGQRRTCPTQRIDLCEECYQDFINYLEQTK